MAGTDVLDRPCTFSVSVRITTFCAIFFAPRRYVIRRKNENACLHRTKKQIQKWKQPEQRRFWAGLVDKLTVFECFPLFLPFFSTFAKVQFALDVQINFRNRVKAGGKLQNIFHTAGYVAFHPVLNKAFSLTVNLESFYYYLFFGAPPKIKIKSSRKLKVFHFNMYKRCVKCGWEN